MKHFFLLIFGISLIYCCPAIGAETTNPVLDPDLVTWRSLAFSSKLFLGTASSIVEFNTKRSQPTIPEQCKKLLNQAQKNAISAVESCLSVTTTIKSYFTTNRFYQTKVWFSPADGKVFRRLRFMRGAKYYLKDYVFTPSKIYRCRKIPANQEEKNLNPKSWSDIQNTSYTFPGKTSATTTTSEPSLLLYYLSASAPKSDTQPREICVFNKKQYHLVKLIRVAPIHIQVEYMEQRNGRNTQVKRGKETLVGYKLTSRPLVEPEGKTAEEFSFMGLTGDIIIYYDRKTRLPIRIDGNIPFIGRVHFKLRQVMRDKRG